MNIKLAPGWLYRAAIVAVAVWVLHSFVEALLAACVAAIASWPLYKRFASRLAAEIHSDYQALMAFLAAPPLLSVVRSRKSDTKPNIAARKTFEQILKDAGVGPADRKKLMAED